MTPESPDESDAETLSELRLLAATNEADAGHYDEAVTQLRAAGELAVSVRGLDLRARIAVQKGQFAEARRLWLNVLQDDPGNEAAREALAKLGSPWVAIAVIKRFTFLAGVATLIALASFGTFALLRPHHCQQIGDLPVETAVQSVKPVSETDAALSSEPKSVPAVAQMPKADRPDARTVEAVIVPPIDGFTIYSSKGQARLVPNEAIFEYRCEFAESAWSRLERLASVLEGKIATCSIVIEGHTDSDPMPPNSKYEDNYELGLYRAFAVGQVLRQKATFPAGSILIASAGDDRPPYPENDVESRARNRTAVIRLIPKSEVSDEEEIVAHEHTH